jgi:hypothetical protein
LYVSQTGLDSGSCTATNPCATITYAITKSGPNPTIEVSGTIDDHVTTSTSLTIAQWPGKPAGVVDGTQSGIPLTINSGAVVSLNQLTIENGSGYEGGISNGGTLTVNDSTISHNTGNGGGGGIYDAPAGKLTVTDSTISDNNPGMYDDGGGIYNDGGTTTVTHSTISDNSIPDATATSDGGLYSDGGTLTVNHSTISDNGGGIFSVTSTLTVNHSTISHNTAGGCGGGIYSYYGTIKVTDSVISHNTGGDDGSYSAGGICNYGTLAVTRSTISHNTANGAYPDTEGAGGGIENIGTLTVTDSTISQNSAPGFVGGIENWFIATVTDSTISGNTAPFDGVTGGTAGGIANYPSATLTVTASTISGNTSVAHGYTGGIFNTGTATVGASILAGNSPGNCHGTLTSKGYNLTNTATGAACGFSQSTDIVDANPELGPLADNGGPTQTMLPGSTSPAANVIPTGTTLNEISACPGIDQRGVTRPGVGESHCTVGAVEVSATS